MRVGDDAQLGRDQANPRARAQGGALEQRLARRAGQPFTGVEVRLEHDPHQRGLVEHVALEPVQQLPLVDARELHAYQRHEHDEQVDRQ